MRAAVPLIHWRIPMHSKTPSRTTLRNISPKTSASKTNGVVDAVLINSPNLSLYLKLQNLLNYFVDCMNNLTAIPSDYKIWAEHFSRCVTFISEFDSSQQEVFTEEIHRMIREFLEDARHFKKLLNSLNEATTMRTRDQTAAVLLTAKASHLQWLSVCILEDLKKTHTLS